MRACVPSAQCHGGWGWRVRWTTCVMRSAVGRADPLPFLLLCLPSAYSCALLILLLFFYVNLRKRCYRCYRLLPFPYPSLSQTPCLPLAFISQSYFLLNHFLCTPPPDPTKLYQFLPYRYLHPILCPTLSYCYLPSFAPLSVLITSSSACRQLDQGQRQMHPALGQPAHRPPVKLSSGLRPRLWVVLHACHLAFATQSKPTLLPPSFSIFFFFSLFFLS